MRRYQFFYISLFATFVLLVLSKAFGLRMSFGVKEIIVWITLLNIGDYARQFRYDELQSRFVEIDGNKKLWTRTLLFSGVVYPVFVVFCVFLYEHLAK